MVMAPESLIFFSVPSWAVAAADRPSAAAASRATAVFMRGFSLGMSEKFYLVQRGCGIAQTLGGRRKERDAEARLGFDQIQEHVAVECQQRAVAVGDGIGGARRLVDQRHLAEDTARAHALDHG